VENVRIDLYMSLENFYPLENPERDPEGKENNDFSSGQKTKSHLMDEVRRHLQAVKNLEKKFTEIHVPKQTILPPKISKAEQAPPIQKSEKEIQTMLEERKKTIETMKQLVEMGFGEQYDIKSSQENLEKEVVNLETQLMEMRKKDISEEPSLEDRIIENEAEIQSLEQQLLTTTGDERKRLLARYEDALNRDEEYKKNR
jgi:septal ring factor EnvC (AmiA/AmiB activator)